MNKIIIKESDTPAEQSSSQLTKQSQENVTCCCNAAAWLWPGMVAAPAEISYVAYSVYEAALELLMTVPGGESRLGVSRQSVIC